MAVLVGLTAVACSGDDDGDGADDRQGAAGFEGRAWVEAIADAQEVIGALSDERNASALDLLGMTDVVEMSPVSLAEARSATDDALSGLGAASGDDPGPAAPTAETASMLEAARAEADRMLPDSSPTNTDAANAVFDDYLRLSDEYWGGIDAVVLDVDDPDLRTALELVLDTGRMQDLAANLVMQLTMTAIDPTGIGSDQVRDITSTWVQLDERATEVRSTPREPYAGAIEAGFPTEYHDALAGQWRSLTDGRAVDIPALLSAQPDQAGDASYLSLHTDLIDLLATEYG